MVVDNTVEELKDSEVRFRSIFENSMDAILLTIPATGTILMANPAACRLFGMTEEELKKVGREGVLVKTDKAKAAINQKSSVGNVHTELTYRRSDGSTFIGEVASSSFIDPKGITKASLIIRDITGRKKAEEALIEDETRLELAQQVARLGSWEFYVKEDRAVWSEELFRIFGFEPKKNAPNIAEYSQLIHPEYLEDVAATMERLLAMGKLGETISFDYCIIQPDGSVRDLHSERMVREVDENGKATRIIGIEQDITERKRTEEALLFERSRLQAVVDNLPVGVMIVDDKGKALMLNKALNSIWQGSRPLEGLEHYNQYLAWDAKSEKKLNAQDWPVSIALQTGQPTGQFELYIERFDGSKGAILTSAVPIKNSEGKIVGGVGVAQDISERKQLERQVEDYTKNLENLVEQRTKELQDKERFAAIGETAGMVGHDIRNPLQAIVSELFLARQVIAEAKDENTKEVLESINMIQEQVDYISKIVSDLQDFARPLKPEYADVDLSDLIVKVFETVSVPDKIKIAIDIQDKMLIKSEPTFIKRSLTNLVNNAIQAMPDGGELCITANIMEGCVVITVSDTGKGIPEHIKPQLFKPLMTTKSKGQGLGLAVVKRLVEGLDGRVSFESVEGKGTKFIIELPKL
jgi:PAS domain S-box-containing protein